MAKQKVIEEITEMMNKYSDTEVRKKLSKSEVHQVEITTQETVAGLLNSTPAALESIFGKDSFYYRGFLLENTKAVWQSVARQMFRKLSSGGNFEGVKLLHGIKINKISDLNLRSRNVRLMAGSTRDRWKVQVEATSYSFTIYEFCRGLRKELWKDWCDRVKEKGVMKPNTALDSVGAHSAISRGTNYSHDAKDTVGVDRFRILLDEIRQYEGPALNLTFKHTTVNLEDWLQDGVSISAEFNPIDEDGYLVGETRVIKGRLEQQGAKLDTDWNQLKPRILDSLQDFVNQTPPSFVNEQEALDFEASKSLREDLKKAKIKKELDGIEKTFKSKSKNTKVKKTIKKQPKRQKRTITKKFNKKAVKVEKQTIAIPQEVRKVVIDKEKGAESPITLNALRGKINRRLPAEVRRNMGRPALINRTGQFSNSVKVLNLVDTGKTITGEYTYTLTGGGQSKNKRGVYSTFENKGIKQWPTGYNPKPLISKSIRNLALQHTDRKFTLRRV
jgi:hypothetical protein